MERSSKLYLLNKCIVNTFDNNKEPTLTKGRVRKGENMKATPNKINWKAVAQRMKDDKERINKFLNTDKEHLLDDIQFIRPGSVRESASTK